jgi:hypothetical protein
MVPLPKKRGRAQSGRGPSSRGSYRQPAPPVSPLNAAPTGRPWSRRGKRDSIRSEAPRRRRSGMRYRRVRPSKFNGTTSRDTDPDAPRRRCQRRNIRQLITHELAFSGQTMTLKQIAKAIDYHPDRTEIALTRMEEGGQVYRDGADRWAIGMKNPYPHKCPCGPGSQHQFRSAVTRRRGRRVLFPFPYSVPVQSLTGGG